MLIPITGRACSGKSTYLYKELSLRAAAGKKCILIVPEQFSFEGEKKVMELTEKAAWRNIEVISFSYMAEKLISKYAPDHMPFIGKRGKILLMNLVLDDVLERLKVYGRVKNRRKLAKQLLDADARLKQSCVSGEELFELSQSCGDENLSAKLHDIGLCLSVYNAAAAENFSDKNSSLSILCELLKDNREYGGCDIAIDDFSGYTADETAVIEQLMISSDDMLVTFCVDTESSRDSETFNLPRKSFRDITSLAKKNGIKISAPVKCENSYYKSAALAHLEKNLFSSSPEEYIGDSSDVTVCRCANKFEECEFAAITAKKLVCDKHLRYRDIAVVERSEGSYLPDLKAAFKRHDLPFFTDNRRSIIGEPPVTYIAAFAENAFCGITSDAVMRMLKSGMDDIDSDEADELDNYIVMYDIDTSQWEKEWKYNPDGLGFAMNENSENKLRRLNELRQRIVGDILDFRKACKDKTCGETAREIYNFAERSDIPNKVRSFASRLAEKGKTDEADALVLSYGEFCECLSDIYDIIGDRYTEQKRFFELLYDIASASTVGVAPSSVDMISVGSADRIRLSDAKAVIIVGVNDGVFPAEISVNGFFSDKEIKELSALGAEISGDAEFVSDRERYITYKAFTYAREKLYISYSVANTDGSALLPSEITEAAIKIMSEDVSISFSDISPLDRVSGKGSAMRYLAENFLSDEPFVSALYAYSRSQEAERTSAVEHLSVKRAPSFSDPSNAKLLYGGNIRVSPSKTEVFFTCPFKYFCKFGLGAKPRSKAELTPAQNGLAVHYVLQRVFDEIGSERLASMSDGEIKESAEKYLGEYISVFLRGIEEKSDRMKYIVRSYITVIVSVLKRLAYEFSQSQFVTADTELKIGDEKNGVAAYRIEDGSGSSVDIIGSVDRVDVFKKDGKCYLRVVDYKTGGKDFRLCDAFEGLNTQMLIYLMCLWQNGEKRYGGEIIPAGVLYIPAKIGELRLDRNADEREISEAQMKNAVMNGLLLKDSTVLRAMGATEKKGYLPAFVTEDGEAGGSVITYGQFKSLHNLIDDIIGKMGESLRGGVIEPLPISGKNHEDTCLYCDYNSVCLHEDGDSVREIAYAPDSELVGALTQEDAEDEQC